MTEANFQRLVIDAAHALGWRVFHARKAQNGKGDWRTPVAADGKGYPDLTMAHPQHGIAFIELKTDRGQPTDQQRIWLDTLRTAAAHASDLAPIVDIWRPRDWDHQIIPTLKHGRTR